MYYYYLFLPIYYKIVSKKMYKTILFIVIAFFLLNYYLINVVVLIIGRNKKLMKYWRYVFVSNEPIFVWKVARRRGKFYNFEVYLNIMKL